ncbi:MAG: hypothetical protein Q9163_005988 [Psora crenata]
MAPIRRYLRITKFSVLELRIYPDNPADTHRWLLQPPHAPALARIIQAVRPLVLPKLREEDERQRGKKGGPTGINKGKGKRGKGVKDVVVGDDFEVAVFLTETSSRHSVLKKDRVVKRRRQVGLGDTVGTREEPVEVDAGDGDGVRLRDIPPAIDTSAVEGQDSREGLFISNDADVDDSEAGEPAVNTRIDGSLKENNEDGKKKLALETTYDGFSIYRRILCLVVKRKGHTKGKELVGGAGQAMMEEWIASTQMQQEQGGIMDE